MNPKLTITVDAKNRALSVASGMIAVGAKIDVEISGLPGDIPPWGSSDAFSGQSARFRLVDECGRDLARYPLADGDGWEQSGGVLSSITPVEFDTDRLRRAFRGVAFDDTLPFGVIVDSAVDAAQYAVGRVKVRQWAAASTEDPTVLPDWRETLDRLQKDLADVSKKRDDAVAAKAEAVSAASEAQSSMNAAAASASSALAAKNGAEEARNSAEEARKSAEEARDSAEAASGDFDKRLKDYAKKEEVKSDLSGKADLVNGKVPANQLPAVDQNMISDADGNVIRADGSSVVMDGSWTCNGVVLTKKEGRDDSWENAENKWVLTHIKNSLWHFAIAGAGGGSASTTAPADATKLSFVIGDITYDATIGRADSVVMAASVIPMGNGTEKIASIAGKDIKAPASPVSSVNGKMGAVNLRSLDVGALSTEGGTVTGPIVMYTNLDPVYLQVGAGGYGGFLEVFSGLNQPASIKKDGKEVATEEQLNAKADTTNVYTKAEVDAEVTNAVLPTNPTFSNAVLSVGLNIDTNSVAVLNDIAETFGGFPLGAGETATTVGGLLAALAAAVSWLKKHKIEWSDAESGAMSDVFRADTELSDCGSAQDVAIRKLSQLLGENVAGY